MFGIKKMFGKKLDNKNKALDFIQYLENNLNSFESNSKGIVHLGETLIGITKHNLHEIYTDIDKISFNRRHKIVINLINISRSYLQYEKEMLTKIYILMEYNGHNMQNTTREAIVDFTKTVEQRVNVYTEMIDLVVNALIRD